MQEASGPISCLAVGRPISAHRFTDSRAFRAAPDQPVPRVNPPLESVPPPALLLRALSGVRRSLQDRLRMRVALATKIAADIMVQNREEVAIWREKSPDARKRPRIYPCRKCAAKAGVPTPGGSNPLFLHLLHVGSPVSLAEGLNPRKVNTFWRPCGICCDWRIQMFMSRTRR